MSLDGWLAEVSGVDVRLVRMPLLEWRVGRGHACAPNITAH